MILQFSYRPREKIMYVCLSASFSLCVSLVSQELISTDLLAIPLYLAL